MARIARLLCVLGVLSVSSSAFADFVAPVPDNEDTNDAWNTVALTLTDGRALVEPVYRYGVLNIDDADFFRVKLQQFDYMMVNTSILNPNFATTITLYNSAGAVIPGSPGSQGAVGYIDNVGAGATYYIGVTGTGAAPYILTIAISQVPEPATMALLAIGGVAMIRRRRKR